MLEPIGARLRALPAFAKLSLGCSTLFVALCCGCLAVLAAWPAGRAEPAAQAAAAATPAPTTAPLLSTSALPTRAAIAAVPSATATPAVIPPTNTAWPTRAIPTQGTPPTPTASAVPTLVLDDHVPPGAIATVVAVVDGDTIDVQLDGQVYRVRYIGVDTPERGQPFYDEATQANAALVQDRTIILVKDVSEADRYGRLLRYVYLPWGIFVNAVLVRQGMAQVATFPPDVAHERQFVQLQQEARHAGRGLWAAAATPTSVAPRWPTHTPSPTATFVPLPTASFTPAAAATWTPASGSTATPPVAR